MIPSFTISLEKVHKLTLYSPQLIEGNYWPVLKIRYGSTTEIAGKWHVMQDFFERICRAKAMNECIAMGFSLG